MLQSILKLGPRSRIALATGVATLAAAGTVLGTVGSSAASAKSGKCIKLAVEFKLQGLSVFDANIKGVDQAAKYYDICGKPAYGGPATASATGQVTDIQADIAKHVNVIAMTSDDPAIPASALKDAMKHGIKVVTFDSDVPSARNFFIQDTAYNTIAQGVINAAVKAEGTSAEFGIMSSTPTATIQLAWISAMQNYVKSKYPNITWAPIGYGESVVSTSLTAAEAMIHANANLKAILPIDGDAVIGTAEAVADLGDSGKIDVFGIGDPLPNQTYFANGSLQGLFLWNEIGQGYMIDCVAQLAYENKIHAGSTFTCPHLTTASGLVAGPAKWTVQTKTNSTTGANRNTIVFSDPLEFTPQNYKKYDF
ncbi:MAG TPA: substrate-binding domain-containing protein [Solirubrobacteraceae bacterium]|nr:substrate-binding domain-containing protein [Solirubrobacteraceae bacterium]